MKRREGLVAIDQTIITHYIEGLMTIERTASILGITPAIVNYRIQQGRKGKSHFPPKKWVMLAPRKATRAVILEYHRDRDGRPINSSDLARYLDVDQSTAARWLDIMGIQRWRKRSVKVRNSAMEQDK